MGYLEQGHHLEKQPGNTFLYAGADVVHFVPEKIRQICAFGVGDALALHPYTMLQFSPGQIADAMEHGCSVIAIGEGGKLAGFAQLWQYGFNENGQQILEFGSWLSFQSGQGKRILLEGVKLGKQIDPEAQIIAVVEKNNIGAQLVLQRCGAIEIGQKFSPVIKTAEGIPALMKIFDVTSL